MAYELNAAEQELAKCVGKRRYEYNRSVGAIATLYTAIDPLTLEVWNFGAELAFCRIHNIYPDIGYEIRYFYDCILPSGKTVDVKYTHWPNGHLLVKCKERISLPYYYALMVGNFPRYAFSGLIKANELLIDNRLNTKSYDYPCYQVCQSELYSCEY